MVSPKDLDIIVKPYIKEALIQCALDIVIVSAMLAIMYWANFPFIYCLLVVLVYFALALFLHYKVVIQLIIDKRHADLITKTISIRAISNEYSFSGNFFGESRVRLFYPKKMQVDKYKIKITDTNDVKTTLRTVMSFRKLLNFAILEKYHINQLQVTYLKRSKILIWVNLLEESEKITSKKGKQAINKALHFINTAV